MAASTPCDVLIIGGGIAGLWSAATLAAAGFAVVLVEKTALGSDQTIASQGILHGGIKYTLGGQASAAAAAIARMPEQWQWSIKGHGDVDLTRVRILSARQYLWTSESLLSRLTAKVASKVIRTPVDRVDAAAACEGLRGAGRGVSIYAVNEPVLDPRSIVESLALQVLRHHGHIEIGEPSIDHATLTVTVHGRAWRPNRLVLAAGAGNEDLLAQLHEPTIKMQRRPLHMVMARGVLPAIYGHCVAAGSDKPRLTITTQATPTDGNTWYIGGRVAEEGVDRDAHMLIERTQAEVRACLPWLTLKDVTWSTHRVDRAEGLTADGSRPDEPVVLPCGPKDAQERSRVIVAWPTKLVFAPLVGQKIKGWLTYDKVKPTNAKAPPGVGLAISELPPIAMLPWERATWT